MRQNHDTPLPIRSKALWLAGAALLLSACGGGAEDSDSAAAPTSATLAIDAAAPAAPDTLTEAAGAQVLLPSFHVAPVILDAPDDADAADNTASARQQPHSQAVPAENARMSTRGLTLQRIESGQRQHALGVSTAPGTVSVQPMISSSAVTTYTPAQIRAAYNLPALPAASALPTAAQAAQLGAGQTIYIVDAMHDPNTAAELAAFNTKFGLPGCTTKAIATNAALPLAAAPAGGGCTFSVVYATANAAMTATAPAYDAGWATEIALDVQWAHATAPLARIVLIEAPDASITSLLGAIRLANAIGPGAVSMSFGGGEGSWTNSVDTTFAAANMTYLAATGDSGAAVAWPSVSPRVLAVGGTTLTYTGSGSRSEVGWASTGGGISAYTATPSYQANTVPGVGTLAHRAVADVAMNADPATGQFVAIISPGTSSPRWLSVGGTSLSTPQWAGVVAAANAVRAQVGKAALGAAHELLYRQVASVPGTYAAAFADVTRGSNGGCSSCVAKAGYDPLTGLGTPQVASLMATLAGAATPTPAPVAPVVASASISGKVGTALTFSVSSVAPNAVSYTLAGAPAGMTIASTGAVAWAAPVAGTYAVTVTAKDTKTGLTGTGVYTVAIAKAALPPVITAPALNGVVGKALSGAITVSDPGGYAMSVSISGIPAGITLSASGQSILLQWAKPVLGKVAIAITVKDTAGLTATATLNITIAAK